MNVQRGWFSLWRHGVGPIGLSASLPTESALTPRWRKNPSSRRIPAQNATFKLGVVRFGHFDKQLLEVLKQPTGPFGALVALQEF